MQSSRVGTTTSARGSPVRSVSFSFCRSGMPNASVLPVPVRACPMTSLPSRAIGSASVWMAKGVTMPSASSASAIGVMTPMSRNAGMDASVLRDLYLI